jgi:replication factor A1
LPDISHLKQSTRLVTDVTIGVSLFCSSTTMSFELTKGICERLTNASDGDTDVFDTPATLQCLNIKPISTTDSAPSDRYRVILSDGENIIPSMLASQAAELIQTGALTKLSVVSVERFTSNYLQNGRRYVKRVIKDASIGLCSSASRIFIALGLQVVGKADGRIGSPKSGGEKSGDVEMTDATSAKPQKSSNSAPSYPDKPGVSWLPIEGLSPYQNSWGIKARVTQKSDIRQWANQRGDGKLFSVTLMDDSGKIRATAFNQSVDAFFNRLEEQKVYFITKGRVSLAKKKFAGSVDNDYEITFDNKTEIEEVCSLVLACGRANFDI